MLRAPVAGVLVLLLVTAVPTAAHEPVFFGVGDGWFSSCHATTIVVPASFVVQGVPLETGGWILSVQGAPDAEPLCPQASASGFLAVDWDMESGGCVGNALGETLCLTDPRPIPGFTEFDLHWTHTVLVAHGTMQIKWV